MRAALLLLSLTVLASAAQAHWADVRFRNLTVTPEGGNSYLFSVQMVNTEGTGNANNVSFDLAGPPGAENLCRRFVSLPAFERRSLECRAEVRVPGRYTLTFQSESLVFDAGSPGPETGPSSPAPRSPGFEAPGAAVALGAALVALRRRSR